MPPPCLHGGTVPQEDDASVISSAAEAARVLVLLLCSPAADGGRAPCAMGCTPSASGRKRRSPGRCRRVEGAYDTVPPDGSGGSGDGRAAPPAACGAALVDSGPGSEAVAPAPRRRRAVVYCKPQNRIDIAARDVLELLASRGGGGRWVREGRVRALLGNTPDTSKGLRLLRTRGVLVRRGTGGRADPFRYMLKAAFAALSPEEQRAPFAGCDSDADDVGSGDDAAVAATGEASPSRDALARCMAPCGMACDGQAAEDGAEGGDSSLESDDSLPLQSSATPPATPSPTPPPVASAAPPPHALAAALTAVLTAAGAEAVPQPMFVLAGAVQPPLAPPPAVTV